MMRAACLQSVQPAFLTNINMLLLWSYLLPYRLIYSYCSQLASDTLFLSPITQFRKMRTKLYTYKQEVQRFPAVRRVDLATEQKTLQATLTRR